MTIAPEKLRILSYPHPSLRRKARRVQDITDEVRAVAARMIELMREAEGVGLAAPQVGLDWRLFVAEIPEGEGRSADAQPATATRGVVALVNPRVVRFEGDLVPHEEGCLSLPEVSGEVRRPAVVAVEGTTLEGEPVALVAGDLLSRCVQHEIDHLDGVLIIDKMTPKSRMRNRTLVRDLEKRAESMAR